MTRQKILIFTIILFTLMTSNTFAYRGTVSHGKYVSPRHELSVVIPDIRNMEILDSGKSCEHCLQSVDFIPDGHYWMMDKAYSLEWFELGKKADDAILKVLPQQMKTEFELHGGHLATPSCQFTKIQGLRAFQCSAQGKKDNTAAGYIGTSMVMNGWLVNAYVLYPTGQQKAPWQPYQRFVESIRIK